MELIDKRKDKSDGKEYRLLELSPELETALKEGTLKLRGGGDGPVNVCTNDTTHTVRRLKQTNTLLVYKETPNDTQGDTSTNTNTHQFEVFASPSDILETMLTEPKIDWSVYPVYTSKQSILESYENVGNIFCSDLEFEIRARDKPLALLNDILYVVHEDVVYETIVNIVSTMVALKDFDLCKPLQELHIISPEPKEIVEAVYSKFLKNGAAENSTGESTDNAAGETTGNPADNSIDKTKLSKWLGGYLLRKHASGLSLRDWQRKWKSDLPLRLDTDIKQLDGEIVEKEPEWFVYVDRSTLPADPKLRFKQLFDYKSTWRMSEITPFLESIVPRGNKIENWVLKYSRKRKVGNEFTVSKR